MRGRDEMRSRHRAARVCIPARRLRRGAGARCAALAALLLAPFAARGDVALPPRFRDTVVLSGLQLPTAVAFAADGRVFVAEKRGTIQVFDGLGSTTPHLFADLRTQVHNYWDRGLLGLALHPDFPHTPYVYVSYAHDAPIGGTAPTWGMADQDSDGCPSPPGPTDNGCVISGRVSRLVAGGNAMSGPEHVLVEDWCQQFPSHSMGALAFGADGALYASGGEGASYTAADYGQFGSPVNPCGDPPAGMGGTEAPPSAMGGALRAQSARRPAGSHVALGGAVLRLDPVSGAALPDNPLVGGTNTGAERIVGYGFRNPFRFTTRPGTSEIWIGDVGWGKTDEIDRILDPRAAVQNFGWPCYEGTDPQSAFQSAGLTQCQSLYDTPGATTAPWFQYDHGESVIPGESCPNGTQSISGLAFYESGNYPAMYQGALFFADYSRACIWVAFPGPDGVPDPSTRANFVIGGAAVDLRTGPDGDLYYVDLNGGTVHRIQYFPAAQPPIAVAQATPTTGPVPLTVQFDASASSDPDAGDTLRFAWDLDGDGQFNDSTAVAPTFRYTRAGSVNAAVRVTDSYGLTAVATVTIRAGSGPPTVSILSPSPDTMWNVGDTITLSATATDPIDGTLPPSAFTWSVVLHHCPADCHTHPIQDLSGVAMGTFAAPDHDYPSYLEIRLTVTDSAGLSTAESVNIYPATVALHFDSVPPGLGLVIGDGSTPAPFDRTVIAKSTTSIGAASPQVLGGTTYTFESWSDGGAQTHVINAGTAPTTFVAHFAVATATPTATQLPTFTPPPTATATDTPTAVDTPTASATPAASPTRSAPPPAPCPADCNGDGTVDVNELVIAVGIGLGDASLSECPAADADGDGTVTIGDLVAGVNALLAGCGSSRAG
jgi:glucose/arabinose dehydrogenase